MQGHLNTLSQPIGGCQAQITSSIAIYVSPELPPLLNHLRSEHKTVVTFILSVSVKCWHRSVHLIVIYFHSALPHGHLVIKLVFYAASLMFFLHLMLQV